MATWRDIGIENFRAAVELYDSTQYRSSCSRLYYAVFSVLTDELIRRGANVDFANGRNTPGHAQMSKLIEKHFVQMSEERRANLMKEVSDLYRFRIAADYIDQRIDKLMSVSAQRSGERIFRY